MPLFLVGQNHAPIAVNDTIEGIVGYSCKINVLRNDYDPDGDSVAISYLNVPGAMIIDDTIVIVSLYHYYYQGLNGYVKMLYKIKDEYGNHSEDSSWAYIVIKIINNFYDSLNINNINARINNVGNQFWGFPLPGTDSPGFFVPKGTRKTPLFCSTLWLGALDDTNGLHIAAERFRQVGRDYWAGPISNNYDSAYDVKWNRIWKIGRSDIEYHLMHWKDPDYIPIEKILTWPGNGDLSAGQMKILAPFHDLNGDGYYDPFSGDYPQIKGDQAIYFIFNDIRDRHSESNGIPLGMEIHGMAYAFECPEDSALWNTIFLHYDCINLSENNYHDLYVGIWSDLEIGFPGDDFAGTDTLLNSIFAYNADWYDDIMFDYGAYGMHPPAQSVTFLNRKLSYSMIYESSYPPYWDPRENEEFYLSLQAKFSNGQHLCFPDSNHPVNHAFPGDPLDSLNGWTMITAGSTPYDKRVVGSNGPIYLRSQDTISIDLAYVFGRDYNGNHLTSVSVLKERIRNIQEYFVSNSSPCGPLFSVSETNKQRNQAFKVYPNPNTGFLNIELYEEYGWREYRIFDVFGRLMKDGKVKDQTILDISLLNPGIYFVQMVFDDFIQTKRIIKMN